MKRRIRRLTPNMLKKIINEERQALKKLYRKKSSQKSTTKKTSELQKNIKFLKESKEEQKKLVLRFKKLFIQRQKAKKNLIERL